MSFSSPIRRRQIYDENSSPFLKSPGSAQSTGRRKQRPTVTPRRFTRFFTRRNISNDPSPTKCRSSRKVLRDITAAGINQQSSALSERDNAEPSWAFPEIAQPKAKRRRVAVLEEPHGEQEPPPSPSARLDRIITARDSPKPRVSGSRSDSIEQTKSCNISQKPEVWLAQSNSSQACRQSLNGFLHREIDPYTLPSVGDPQDWQTETTNFSTTPQDKHFCKNFVGSSTSGAVPFCTASCNKQSLIAIGDEEGGVRLLETELEGKYSFSTPYLSFRPHRNAVLDLAFSHDDMLLATGAGDQSAQIIDVTSQQVIRKLSGHTASVKQVRFQPGHSDIIATSSRDGSVLLWDIRCRTDGCKRSVMQISASPEPESEGLVIRTPQQQAARDRVPTGAIPDAHGLEIGGTSIVQNPTFERTKSLRAQAPGVKSVSVTSLAFLGHGRDHLFLTGGQESAAVKLWDLRATHTRRSRHSVALSATQLPQTHSVRRHWALTSINVSSDGSKFFTVCKDNTVYAYSTSHLMLGHAPELSLDSTNTRQRRFAHPEKRGLGPIYGFRHPRLQVNSFYVKAAVRQSNDANPELLAVGSSEGSAIVFAANERYLSRAMHEVERSSMLSPNITGRNDQEDSLPIFETGTALIRGHDKEVTDVTWTPNGDLVTIGDDLMSRCWREGPRAREVRKSGEGEGKRWESGWAEALPGWDEDDE